LASKKKQPSKLLFSFHAKLALVRLDFFIKKKRKEKKRKEAKTNLINQNLMNLNFLMV